MSQHHGSCHCGAVQFEVEADVSKLATCNCSICGRTGAIMVFAPASSLSGVVGEDRMTDYQFGRRTIHHSFCATCGVRPFGRGVGPDGSEMVMINVRCLDGVDVHTLTIGQQYDGKSF